MIQEKYPVNFCFERSILVVADVVSLISRKAKSPMEFQQEHCVLKTRGPKRQGTVTANQHPCNMNSKFRAERFSFHHSQKQTCEARFTLGRILSACAQAANQATTQ